MAPSKSNVKIAGLNGRLNIPLKSLFPNAYRLHFRYIANGIKESFLKPFPN